MTKKVRAAGSEQSPHRLRLMMPTQTSTHRPNVGGGLTPRRFEHHPPTKLCPPLPMSARIGHSRRSLRDSPSTRSHAPPSPVSLLCLLVKKIRFVRHSLTLREDGEGLSITTPFSASALRVFSLKINLPHRHCLPALEKWFQCVVGRTEPLFFSCPTDTHFITPSGHTVPGHHLPRSVRSIRGKNNPAPPLCFLRSLL